MQAHDQGRIVVKKNSKSAALKKKKSGTFESRYARIEKRMDNLHAKGDIAGMNRLAERFGH